MLIIKKDKARKNNKDRCYISKNFFPSSRCWFQDQSDNSLDGLKEDLLDYLYDTKSNIFEEKSLVKVLKIKKN